MKFRSSAIFLFFLAVGTSKAWAYSAADYDKAGLQLYNAKRYGQADQYFGAALKLSPNDAGALMGSANCLYAEGKTDQALAGYRKLQALQPDNRSLTDFIRSLEAQRGPVPAAAAPRQTVSATALSGDVQQGESFYNQKQYAASVPCFQRAIAKDPKSSEAYQYLGLAQVRLGDLRDGAVALEEYNQLHPDPSVEGYAMDVRGQLSPADQMWVDAQLSRAGIGASASVSSPAIPKALGVYFEPDFAFIQLADFETDAKTWRSIAQTRQATDPNTSFTGSVPTADLGVGVEPMLKLTKNLQLGIPLAFCPMGSASESVSNSDGSESDINSYLISAFTVGLELKYLIFQGGDFEPFVSVTPYLEPISIDYSSWHTASGATQKIEGNYSGTTEGAVFKAGTDWHLDDTFVLSPSIGYVFASPTQFTGSVTYNDGSQPNGPSGLEMEPDAGGNGDKIEPLPKGSTPPLFSRPVAMDLSGFEFGIHLGAFF